MLKFMNRNFLLGLFIVLVIAGSLIAWGLAQRKNAAVLAPVPAPAPEILIVPSVAPAK